MKRLGLWVVLSIGGGCEEEEWMNHEEIGFVGCVKYWSCL
jgi:hypothetical protein